MIWLGGSYWRCLLDHAYILCQSDHDSGVVNNYIIIYSYYYPLALKCTGILFIIYNPWEPSRDATMCKPQDRPSLLPWRTLYFFMFLCAVQVAKRELALECDYSYEARCQQQFRQLVAADEGFHINVNVPQVITELCTPRLLTTELVPGAHIDKVGLPLQHHTSPYLHILPCMQTCVDMCLGKSLCRQTCHKQTRQFSVSHLLYSVCGFAPRMSCEAQTPDCGSAKLCNVGVMGG